MTTTPKMHHFVCFLLSLLFIPAITSCDEDDCCSESVLKVDSSTLICAWNQGSWATINLTGNMPWVMVEALPGWVTLSTTSGNAGTTSITVTMSSDNDSLAERSHLLTFCAANGDKATVTVIQKPKPPTYSASFVPTRNMASANGVTATGVITPSAPQMVGTNMTVTVTLTGQALLAGTHLVKLTSAKAGLTATQTEVVTAGQAMGTGIVKTFTFVMPAQHVDDLIVEHTFTNVTFLVSFSVDNANANGLTAKGSINPSGPRVEGEYIKVTLTLEPGTPLLSGTHIVNLTSTKAGTIAVANPQTLNVTAGVPVPSTPFDFYFTMSAFDVNDLVVEHTFTNAVYNIGFSTNGITVNGIKATATLTPVGPQIAGTTITVTVELNGVATEAGLHSVNLMSSSTGFPLLTHQSRDVSASETVFGETLVFTFTMPSNDVEISVQHSFIKATLYSIGVGFTLGILPPSSTQTQEGMVVSATISPATPQVTGTAITVTLKMEGTASTAGIHSFNLNSSGPLPLVTAPTVTTRMVAAGETVLGETFVFTFNMPASNVTLNAWDLFQPGILETLLVVPEEEDLHLLLRARTPEAGYAFYYTHSPTSVTAYYGVPIFSITGATEYTTDTHIPLPAGTPSCIQVYKVDLNTQRIVGFGEGSATPTMNGFVGTYAATMTYGGYYFPIYWGVTPFTGTFDLIWDPISSTGSLEFATGTLGDANNLGPVILNNIVITHTTTPGTFVLNANPFSGYVTGFVGNSVDFYIENGFVQDGVTDVEISFRLQTKYFVAPGINEYIDVTGIR